ncbi:MAG: 50S ribosomal protein L29 [Proteobacteria bacterium]|nr:50S ribosomal protein L29 [Pseudomonadota bacterium]
MRAKELRERSAQELQGLIDEAKQTLFQTRIKNATHQLTDTSSVQKARREVARIETVLAERKKATRKADGK